MRRGLILHIMAIIFEDLGGFDKYTSSNKRKHKYGRTKLVGCKKSLLPIRFFHKKQNRSRQ